MSVRDNSAVSVLRRWPRKNDPDSIRARQEVLRGRLDGDGEVFGYELVPWMRAQ